MIGVEQSPPVPSVGSTAGMAMVAAASAELAAEATARTETTTAPTTTATTTTAPRRRRFTAGTVLPPIGFAALVVAG